MLSIDSNVLRVDLDPTDPDPVETVKFMVEAYRKERYPGTLMNVIDRVAKGPHML